jgi:DNA-binding winged helix-turn-helix (wHTH) protein
MKGQQNHFYEFGSFRLDPAEHTLLHDGKVVSLTPKVFDTLLILIENNGHLVEKDQLLEQIWADTIVEEANLAKNISILRKVLSEDGLKEPFIETVPKRGYRFVAPVKEIKSGNSNPTEKTPKSKSLNNSKPKIVVIAVIFLISAFVFGYYFYSNARNVKPLTDKDVILLTDFENKTGEEIFDGTLKQGLIMQLQQSPFLSIFPDEQAHDTLKLMKRNPDEKITRELAKEICQRQGLKAYIAGTISKLGNIYIVGLETVNTQTGETIALTQEEAESKEKVLKALSVAATKMRGMLGESLAQIEELNKPLNVTTSSLEALQAFAMAKESAIKGNSFERIQHGKRAIEIDPNFASAYVSLSVGYWNTSHMNWRKRWQQKLLNCEKGYPSLKN